MSSAVPASDGADADVSPSNEGRLISATFSLAMMRKQHPELGRAEAEARLMLAAAIQKLDSAEEIAEESEQPSPGGRGTTRIHTLNEQTAVERAKDAYADALAALLRGDAG